MKVFIIAAVSIDGFIAQKKQQSSFSWTSQEDKQFFKQKSMEAGVVVMGKNTFATIGKPLPRRLNAVYTRQTKSKLCANYDLDLNQYSDDLLQVTSLPPKKLVAQLEKQGYPQAAVSGGSSIYHQFLESGVVDELYLTIEPIMFGQGINLTPKKLTKRFSLKESRKLNDKGTMLLVYKKQ